jgi:hypothetical protein
MRFVYYNIWLLWSAKVDSTPIGKTIIFDGKLWSCKLAYRYERLERTPIWEYPKIGPWFEIKTSVDADLRSGRRLETGRRSEYIIYAIKWFSEVSFQLGIPSNEICMSPKLSIGWNLYKRSKRFYLTLKWGII